MHSKLIILIDSCNRRKAWFQWLLNVKGSEKQKNILKWERPGGGGADSHVKQTGMLFVSQRGVNFVCLVSLRVFRVKRQYLEWNRKWARSIPHSFGTIPPPLRQATASSDNNYNPTIYLNTPDFTLSFRFSLLYSFHGRLNHWMGHLRVASYLWFTQILARCTIFDVV